MEKLIKSLAVEIKPTERHFNFGGKLGLPEDRHGVADAKFRSALRQTVRPDAEAIRMVLEREGRIAVAQRSVNSLTRELEKAKLDHGGLIEGSPGDEASLRSIAANAKQLEALAERVQVAEAGLAAVKDAAETARREFVFGVSSEAGYLLDDMRRDARAKEPEADAAIRAAFLEHVSPLIEARLALWALTEGLRVVDARYEATQLADEMLAAARKPRLAAARSA